MLKEDDFINDIWKKHDEYNRTRNKDKFFLKHLYRNTENLLTLKSLLTLVIAIIATAGATYAGFITYNYITKETYTDFKQNPNYDYSQDMIYQNNFYYKKVMTYEEYEKCKEVWNDLVEMNEEDFNDNFVVIVAVENTSMLGLTVSDVSADDTTLYIKFKKDENEDYDKTVTSIKISKNLDRDIIKIEKVEKNIDYTDYERLEDLPHNYSKEQAIKDNCFVLENNEIISSNKEQLNEFVDNARNGINSFIRIVSYFDEQVKIKDLEYKDGEYILVSDDSRTRDKVEKFYYNYGDEIVVEHKSIGTIYAIKDNKSNSKIYFASVK